MAPRRIITTFRIDDDLLDGLRTVWERDGVQVSEQVRRAIRAWLIDRGVITKPDRRATPRKRSR